MLSNAKILLRGALLQLADTRSPQLLNKDFYHITAGELCCIFSSELQVNQVSAANLEVKSKAPNGVTFNVKGKTEHDGPISGSVSTTITRRKPFRYSIRHTKNFVQLEGKYEDKATGTYTPRPIAVPRQTFVIPEIHAPDTGNQSLSTLRAISQIKCVLNMQYLSVILADRTLSPSRPHLDPNVDNLQLPRHQSRTRRSTRQRS
jgi:hypothetical protein